MALSKNVIEFLGWLEENGQLFDCESLIAFVGGPDGAFIREYVAEDPQAHAEYIEFRRRLRKAASQATESKWQSTDVAHEPERFLSAVAKLPIDDPLDEYVTELALREVPAAVSRLRKLSAIRLQKTPNDEITKFFRQAVTCYVCGLYDAVAVLSRSVLEFTLRETLAQRGLLPAQSNGHGQGSVQELIDLAGKAKILKLDAVQNAHSVRRTGNSVHEKGISEREALTAASLTLQVLIEIYGRKKS